MQKSSLPVLNSGRTQFKVRLSSSKKFGFIYFNRRPLNVMKNAFYSMLKALYVIKIFKVLSDVFGDVRKRIDKKVKINLKIDDVTDWTNNN